MLDLILPIGAGIVAAASGGYGCLRFDAWTQEHASVTHKLLAFGTILGLGCAALPLWIVDLGNHPGLVAFYVTIVACVFPFFVSFVVKKVWFTSKEEARREGAEIRRIHRERGWPGWVARIIQSFSGGFSD